MWEEWEEDEKSGEEDEKSGGEGETGTRDSDGEFVGERYGLNTSPAWTHERRGSGMAHDRLQRTDIERDLLTCIVS